MKTWLVLAVALAGCSDKKQQEPPPPPQQPVQPAPDPACVDRTHQLGDWLKALTTAGPLPFTSLNAKLVKLDGAAAATLPEVPVVTISATMVEFQGRLLADPTTAKPGELAKTVADAVAPTRATGIAFVIDDKTPWSVIAPAVTAASGEVKGPVTFVFEAGAPSTLTPPPKSAIDAELDALDKFDPAAKVKPLPKPGDPTLVDKVFKGCPKIASDVLPKIGAAADAAAKDAVVTNDLPAAIAACGCKVEIASVQRLVWAWYNRDTGIPMAAITLHVGKPGTKLTAKPDAPWSETSKLVADAAKAAKPIFLQ